MNYTSSSSKFNSFALETVLASSLGAEADAMQGDFLILPGNHGFKQTGLPRVLTRVSKKAAAPEPYLYIEGIPRQLIENDEDEVICPECGARMYKNGWLTTRLKDIPCGKIPTVLGVTGRRHHCPYCRCDIQTRLEFKAAEHLITQRAALYAEDLLRLGLTLKDVTEITGLGINVVKDIDKKRLAQLYTVNGDGKTLIKPERQATKLGVDEFLLHEGRKFATIIIDLDTGHVLWLSHGKKKQCVYDFIEHAGMEFMQQVKCVASDMNSDYVEAFQDQCPWIKVVYDHFHIVQSLNQKVISEVRKDEQRRLIKEGRKEEAKALKGTKYILMTKAETRTKHDNPPQNKRKRRKSNDKVICIFDRPAKPQKQKDIEALYKKLISENQRLFTCDLVKEKLDSAYKTSNTAKMRTQIDEIIAVCESTENKHFLWFARLLKNHLDGIINHAEFNVSTGKVEGTNAMIKNLRRRHFGLPDDDYFFLKVFDASRQKSHKNN